MPSCTTGRMIYGILGPLAIVTIVECNFLLFAIVNIYIYIHAYVHIKLCV